MTQESRPHVLPIESGVVRIQQVLGAERTPGMIGVCCAAMMFFIALNGQWKALYGLIIVAFWHAIWVFAFRRDPQYWAILWRMHWQFPIPSRLAPAPGICAPPVPIEPSVPVRAEAGAYGE